jgi:hypothetical protein
MAERVFGMKKEATYGVQSGTVPDWHEEVTSNKFELGDDPVTSTGGSRMIKQVRPGVMKPTGTTEGNVDLERIGHYLAAFLDNYLFTAGQNGFNTHEFWGGENTELSSFTGYATFDYFMKTIVGMLCDGLKIEVSDEFMTHSADWIYKDESSEDIDPKDFEEIITSGAIPIMFYDVDLKLNDAKPSAIMNSFSFEGKNNLNQDGTIGFGSRRPQLKASAQQREISLSLVSLMDKNSVDLIRAAEYGETQILSPSACQLLKTKLELDVKICEDASRSMKIIFPECAMKVEYDAKDSDQIEVTWNLTTLGTGKVTLLNNKEVVTDMYAQVVNAQTEITDTAVTGNSTVTANVRNGTNPVDAATVTLTNIDDNSKTFTGTTDSTGACTIATVPYAKYKVTATATGMENYTRTTNLICDNKNENIYISMTPTA